MKPRKTLVKDLNDKIRPHSIRLMVIDKGNTQNSPNNKQIHYQRIVFQDEEQATAWAELTTRDFEQLTEVAESFPIIGFTSLNPPYHKGFSLSTTSSTYVMLKSAGDKVDTLRVWHEANGLVVSVKHSQVVDVQ
ncbi:uncharacterized protein LOC141621422 [Silene latifolia]|uniref:uncharacterized protein LOC141621422 n=1 Tax=Silene latifolia TaxID=37657 RepID=UPI003D76CA6B